MLVDDDLLALASLTQTLRHHLPAAIVEAYADPTLALRRLQKSAVCRGDDGV